MRNRGGFTIVETLIVLAVTGVLFFTTLNTISGRHGRIEFTQSMREIDARVKDTLNDVSNGFYPTVSNLGCDAAIGTTPPVFSYSATAVTTGTNGNCVSAGKVLQFGTDSQMSDTRIYSMAGRRNVTIGTNTHDVSNISELKPKVIDVIVGGHTLDATDRSTLPSGIKLVKNDGTTTSHVAFGIYYQNFGGQSINGQSTGASAVSIALLNPYIATYSESAVIVAAESINSDAQFLPSNGTLIMCFKSGTSNQFATITLTGDRSGFTTDLALDVLAPALSGVACV